MKLHIEALPDELEGSFVEVADRQIAPDGTVTAVRCAVVTPEEELLAPSDWHRVPQPELDESMADAVAEAAEESENRLLEQLHREGVPEGRAQAVVRDAVDRGHVPLAP